MISTMRAQIEEKDRKIEGQSEETRQFREVFRDFDGVLAESKITAFEMWREILEFL